MSDFRAAHMKMTTNIKVTDWRHQDVCGRKGNISMDTFQDPKYWWSSLLLLLIIFIWFAGSSHHQQDENRSWTWSYHKSPWWWAGQVQTNQCHPSTFNDEMPRTITTATDNGYIFLLKRVDEWGNKTQAKHLFETQAKHLFIMQHKQGVDLHILLFQDTGKEPVQEWEQSFILIALNDKCY